MALELARYERVHQVVVHRYGCRVWSTVSRGLQVSPVVEVDEGWRVEGCSECQPSFGVVSKERHRVVSRSTVMVERFGLVERKRRGNLALLNVDPTAVVHAGWQAEAACRSSSERLAGWFNWLFTADTGRRWQTDVQKAICLECPVRVDCLLVGVWSEEPWGVWGGATALERRLLRNRWNREGREMRISPDRNVAVG